MFKWWKNHNEIRATDYTLRLKRRFRECVDVIYQEAGREFLFGGDLVGKSWRQINISLPRTLPDQDIERIAPRLAAALTKLRYEYVIVQVHGTEEVPASEQEGALGKLREMGYEPEVGPEGRTLKLTKRGDWMSPGHEHAKEPALQMMQLINSVRGKRARVKILAKSDSAIADFV